MIYKQGLLLYSFGAVKTKFIDHIQIFIIMAKALIVSRETLIANHKMIISIILPLY